MGKKKRRRKKRQAPAPPERQAPEADESTPPSGDAEGLSKRLRKHQAQVRAGTFELPWGEDLDKRRPKRRVLATDAYTLIASGLGYGLLVLGSAAGFWALFFEQVIPLDALRAGGTREGAKVALYFGGMAAAVVLGFVSYSFARWRQARRRTATRPALLLRARIHKQTSSQVTTGAAAVTYEYEVDRDLLVRDEYPFGSTYNSNWSKHERKLKQFTDGDVLQIKVDPKDPRNGGLSTRDSRIVFPLLLILEALPLGAALGFGLAAFLV